MVRLSAGRFIPVGMRKKIEDPDAWVVNTCAMNDTPYRGDDTRWAWINPTNRAIEHPYHDIRAVSVEALWQGTKLTAANPTYPNMEAIRGDWRKGKGKRPIGAYAGIGHPPITSPGEARRAIYIPAFRRLFDHWQADPAVADLLERARAHSGPVYLRDFDTGQGIDRNGPMSHAWLLATYLNTGSWEG